MSLSRVLTLLAVGATVFAQGPQRHRSRPADAGSQEGVQPAFRGKIIAPPVMGGEGDGEPVPVNCAGQVTCPVGTIVTFNTRQMNIPFQLVTIQDGSGAIDPGEPLAAFASPYFSMASQTLNQMNSGTLYDRVSAVKDYYENVKRMSVQLQGTEGIYGAYATMVLSTVYAIASIAASENTQWRGFMFHVPVAANYSITCRLKGGWDKPRNRVVLNGDGRTVIDYQEQLVSDRSKNWQVRLEPGFYYINVGLGSGSSTVFHTAGDLSSVVLNETQPVTFQVPMVLASKTLDVAAAMPGPGASTQVTVRLPTQAELDALTFPDLLDGSKPVISPAAALPAQSGPTVPLLYRQLLATGTNYCFIFNYPGAMETQAPQVSGGEVRFSLMNTGNTTEQRCSVY